MSTRQASTNCDSDDWNAVDHARAGIGPQYTASSRRSGLDASGEPKTIWAWQDVTRGGMTPRRVSQRFVWSGPVPRTAADWRPGNRIRPLQHAVTDCKSKKFSVDRKCQQCRNNEDCGAGRTCHQRSLCPYRGLLPRQERMRRGPRVHRQSLPAVSVRQRMPQLDTLRSRPLHQSMHGRRQLPPWQEVCQRCMRGAQKQA
jgi:hypothetical protein